MMQIMTAMMMTNAVQTIATIKVGPERARSINTQKKVKTKDNPSKKKGRSHFDFT